MVVYKCERCKKIFNQKCKYDEHCNRKIPCLIQKKNNKNNNHYYYCELCDQQFSRSDTLKKHYESQTHNNKEKTIMNANINTNNGNVYLVGGNNKNVVKNYYFISPFSNEETDKLTSEEKIAIFTCGTNPIIMIIIKTNLNPNTPEYHNVGYTNMNNGWGYVFNGETWEKKSIQIIMNELLSSKRDDLMKIYDEIKEYLSEEQNKNIKNKINDISLTVEPKLEHQVRSKKRLVLDLKTNFSGNKHLILNAIEKSKKPIINKFDIIQNKVDFKNGMTLEDVVKKMDQKKELSVQLKLKKELAINTLQKLNELNNKEYKSIFDRINQTTDIEIINIINRLLNKSFTFKNKINNDIINNQIDIETEISNFLFDEV
jgi:hypothetical protein